jgi:hypothetical protein
VNFQGRVRKIIIDRCVALFQKRSAMLKTHTTAIIEIMMNSGG